MKDLVGIKVLITTTNWFYAPDGLLYRGVWGTLISVKEAKESFGFTPNRSHANWFIEVGDMIITGCQVNYCMKCENEPVLENVVDWSSADNREFTRPGQIYKTT